MLQFSPPSVRLDVLTRGRAAFRSVDTREGMRLFDASLDVDSPALASSRILRNAGISHGASGVMGSVRRVLRPSEPSDARATLNRPKFARATPRAVLCCRQRRG